MLTWKVGGCTGVNASPRTIRIGPKLTNITIGMHMKEN